MKVTALTHDLWKEYVAPACEGIKLTDAATSELEFSMYCACMGAHTVEEEAKRLVNILDRKAIAYHAFDVIADRVRERRER